MLQFGVRGHDFGRLPLEDLARAIADKGYGCLQLALAKALSDIDTSTGKLSTGLGRYVAGTFARHGIRIAVLGCYINPLHPDPAERRKGIDRFKEHLRFAHDFGCSIVGTETGSVRADYGPDGQSQSEASLNALIRVVAELVSEAEKFGVLVGIEAVVSHVVSTSRRMRRVLDAVASNNLQVIFDPVNLMDQENQGGQDALFGEAFDLFGERIQVLHAKDVRFERGVRQVVPVGQGLVDYRLVVDLVGQAKPWIDTLLEDTKPEFLDESRRHLATLLTPTELAAPAAGQATRTKP
jgi:L-ribulose-5-phosphate 3-epimerase